MGAGERSRRGPSFTRGELHDAIENGGIEVRLQPLVSIRSGVVSRLEALARWQHPQLGPVPPTSFVPFAERVGLVGPLMVRVVREALRGLPALRKRLPELRVAVNVSALTLEDSGLSEFLTRVLRDVGCEGSCLGVEITESVLMAEPELAHRTLEALRASGVRIDVDDFGTGYSSLGRLAELPLDAVKIDREFVTPMTKDHRREAIVRAVIALGHDLGFEVVAEGVEDIETWEQLAALGCDTAQGYQIARPMAPEAVSDWISSWESGLAFMRRERIGERIVAYQRTGLGDAGERPVLVVDDEPSILEVIRGILEHEGFRVLTAANGTEALKLLERNRPLLVLLDMSMPTLDGARFTAEIRERGLRVPIVVMTAGPSAERWARELRADGYLSKPFEMAGLLEMTNRFAGPAN